MAAIKSFDVSREGKDLRIRMQAGDMTVARLSRALQASKQHTVEFCSERDSQKYLVNRERFSFRLNQILSTSRKNLETWPIGQTMEAVSMLCT